MDVNQQWRELQENYAALADEELEAIAQEAYNLTDIARQALQAEISRRNLNIEMRLQAPGQEAEEAAPPEGYPPGFDPEDWGLIGFTYVETLDAARALKKCLDDAGIPSYYGPNVVDDLRLLPTPFPRSVHVKVRETDRDRAHYVLSRCPPPPEYKPEEIEITDYVGHCPKCHSSEIVLEAFDEATEDSPAPKYHWSCDACGHQWQDDGTEPES